MPRPVELLIGDGECRRPTFGPLDLLPRATLICWTWEKEKPRLRTRKEPAGALSDAGKGFTAPGRLERGKAAVPNGRSEGSLPDPARARLIRTFFGARRKETRGRKHS